MGNTNSREQRSIPGAFNNTGTILDDSEEEAKALFNHERNTAESTEIEHQGSNESSDPARSRTPIPLEEDANEGSHSARWHNLQAPAFDRSINTPPVIQEVHEAGNANQAGGDSEKTYVDLPKVWMSETMTARVDFPEVAKAMDTNQKSSHLESIDETQITHSAEAIDTSKNVLRSIEDANVPPSCSEQRHLEAKNAKLAETTEKSNASLTTYEYGNANRPSSVPEPACLEAQHATLVGARNSTHGPPPGTLSDIMGQQNASLNEAVSTSMSPREVNEVSHLSQDSPAEPQNIIEEQQNANLDGAASASIGLFREENFVTRAQGSPIEFPRDIEERNDFDHTSSDAHSYSRYEDASSVNQKVALEETIAARIEDMASMDERGSILAEPRTTIFDEAPPTVEEEPPVSVLAKAISSKGERNAVPMQEVAADIGHSIFNHKNAITVPARSDPRSLLSTSKGQNVSQFRGFRELETQFRDFHGLEKESGGAIAIDQLWREENTMRKTTALEPRAYEAQMPQPSASSYSTTNGTKRIPGYLSNMVRMSREGPEPQLEDGQREQERQDRSCQPEMTSRASVLGRNHQMELGTSISNTGEIEKTAAPDARPSYLTLPGGNNVVKSGSSMTLKLVYFDDIDDSPHRKPKARKKVRLDFADCKSRLPKSDITYDDRATCLVLKAAYDRDLEFIQKSDLRTYKNFDNKSGVKRHDPNGVPAFVEIPEGGERYFVSYAGQIALGGHAWPRENKPTHSSYKSIATMRDTSRAPLMLVGHPRPNPARMMAAEPLTEMPDELFLPFKTTSARGKPREPRTRSYGSVAAAPASRNETAADDAEISSSSSSEDEAETRRKDDTSIASPQTLRSLGSKKRKLSDLNISYDEGAAMPKKGKGPSIIEELEEELEEELDLV